MSDRSSLTYLDPDSEEYQNHLIAERIEAILQSGAMPSDLAQAWYEDEWLNGGLKDAWNLAQREGRFARDQAVRDRNTPAGRRKRRDEQEAISQEAKNHTPVWIPRSVQKLLDLYKDTLVLEKAYQHFIDNFDDYQPAIERASTSMTATGGGTIATKEMAEKALGDVVWPEGGDYLGGTNWLSVKTKWRQFGLITGYNVQFQRKAVLAGGTKSNVGEIMGTDQLVGMGAYQSLIEGDDEEYRWWNYIAPVAGVTQVVQSVAGSVEFNKDRAIEVLTFTGSPRYITGVGGASEPGLSNAALENEVHHAFQSVGTEWLTPGESDWFYGDGTPFGMDGWPRGYDPSDVPSYFGPGGDKHDPIGVHQGSNPNVTLFTKDFTGVVLGQMAANDKNVPWNEGPHGGASGFNSGVWISRHPFYRGAGIHVDDFFKNPPGQGYQNSIHGHFLSPQILYYLQLIAGGAGTGRAGQSSHAVDPLPLIAARATLGAKGTQIVNGAAAHVPGYQKLKVQEEFWSEGPFGSNTWKTYFGTGEHPYAGSQLASWAPGLSEWIENTFAGDEAQDYWSRELTSESRLLKARGTTEGIPDKLGIYPTLPLQGIDNAALGETQLRTFGDDYSFSGEMGHRYEHVVNAMAPYKNYIVNELPALVDAHWDGLYKNFAGDGTSPNGAIFAVDQAIRQLIGPITLEGDALDRAVERILDFFGAGTLDPTAAQSREADVSGGGDHSSPNLENITEEARNVLTNFRSLTPFDLQCFLMENIGTLTGYKEKAEQTYSNLIKLRGEPGETISQLQHGNKTDAIKEILNLTPAVYALLEPYVKIYRVDYSKDEGAARPLVQTEMPIPNFTDPNDVGALTSARGRTRGWGLQSFTWKLDGVQPAEVDNNISANLSFYFQSVTDLFESSRSFNKVTGDQDGPYQAGLVTADGAPIVAPLDLLISAATVDTVKNNGTEDAAPEEPKSPPDSCTETLKNTINQEYDGARFRIKVVAGWSTPTRRALRAVMPGKTDADLTKLIDAISATRIALYLQQVRHNLTFNQNGSVKLSIDYQAALTGILTSNKLDILGASDKAWKAKMDAMKKEIDEVKASITTRAEVLSAAALKDDSTYKSLKEELKTLLEKKKNLVNEDKVKKYKRFLKNLYGTTVRGQSHVDSTRIYTVVLDATEAIKVPLHKLTDSKSRARRAIKRLSKNPGFTLHNDLGSATANTNLLDAIINSQKEGDGGTVDVNKVTNHMATGQWANNLTSRGDKIYIPYFYLGDLIDSIIENNAALGHGGDVMKMIRSSYITFLGDLDVTNPLLLYASENSDALICADSIKDNELLAALRAKGLVFQGGIKKRINIGSIPIGLDQFNVWFKNHVVKSQRNTYYLLHFIKDLCAYLISGALKKACYETNVINDIRFDTSIVHFNNRGDEGNLKIRPGSEGAPEYTVSQLAAAIGATTPENDIPSWGMSKEQQDKMNLTSGLVVYCTDSKPKGRHGRYDDDVANGIYHHYIGSAAGLVKKISFSRVDQQYLREAKIQRYGHLGAQQLRELYSATIDMAGNTLFKNGQYTFIWPTSMVSHDKEMAQLLGLGGYFLITGVSHKISPSGYSVSVKALQEGLAFTEEPVAVVALPAEAVASLETSSGEPATTAGGSSSTASLPLDAVGQCQDGAVESQETGHGTDPAAPEADAAGGTPESTEPETFTGAATDYVAGMAGGADSAAGTEGAFTLEGREDELAAIYARGGNPFPDYGREGDLGLAAGRALYRSLMAARRRAQRD